MSEQERVSRVDKRSVPVYNGEEIELKPKRPLIPPRTVRLFKAFGFASAMAAPLFIYIKYWIVPEAEARHDDLWREARNRGYVYDPATNPTSVVTVAPGSKRV